MCGRLCGMFAFFPHCSGLRPVPPPKPVEEPETPVPQAHGHTGVKESELGNSKKMEEE